MKQPHTTPAGAPPLFTTRHHMPAYKPGEYGNWRISVMGLGHDHGYTSGVWLMENMPVLMRRGEKDPDHWETWMSLSPHELESQELAIRYAYGHVVVMGLGLGWLAVNVALSEPVTQVTVIEYDPSVIELFHRSGAASGLPDAAREKLTIVQADALEWTPARPVDFLYADIWKNLNEEHTLDQIRTMYKNVKAERVYFWGQELTIHEAWRKVFPDEDTISAASVERVVTGIIGLPLLIPSEPDYAEMIQSVIDNRRKRGLPV